MSPAIIHLATRVAANPRFLAHPLDRFQREQGFTDALLAFTLAMPLDRLPYLRLCGLPRADRWADDVAMIAVAAGCECSRLSELLRELEVSRA